MSLVKLVENNKQKNNQFAQIHENLTASLQWYLINGKTVQNSQNFQPFLFSKFICLFSRIGEQLFLLFYSQTTTTKKFLVFGFENVRKLSITEIVGLNEIGRNWIHYWAIVEFPSRTHTILSLAKSK